MINNDKWINSLPNVNVKRDEESFQIDHNKWVNTIPKKNTLNSVKKYSFMTIIFIFGLFFIPAFGIAGLAISTVLIQFFACIYLYFKVNQTELKIIPRISNFYIRRNFLINIFIKAY